MTAEVVVWDSNCSEGTKTDGSRLRPTHHPQGHPDRSLSLNTLAKSLSTRYDQLRAMADLDEAIVLGREALELRPQGHPDRSLSLNTLAKSLSTRYDQLRAMADLDEAIVLGREALELRPQGHPDCSLSLNHLANKQRRATSVAKSRYGLHAYIKNLVTEVYVLVSQSDNNSSMKLE
ncbi:hypothetical protein EV363DRAFT_1548509 [Boletus edulis]|nr:hypothetical protein EV363DRAFT_1548509 [Boletus edulis]